MKLSEITFAGMKYSKTTNYYKFSDIITRREIFLSETVMKSITELTAILELLYATSNWSSEMESAPTIHVIMEQCSIFIL